MAERTLSPEEGPPALTHDGSDARPALMIKIKMPNWEIFAVHVWSLLLFIVILSVLALIGSVLVVLLEP